jgi:5-methylcytosine-specific restriction endonuclease McrA
MIAGQTDDTWLPPSERVDVGVLSKIFADRTTSYKYFFFLALTNRLEQAFKRTIDPEFDIARPIPQSLLAAEMTVLAWYPTHFCRLSLGSQDQLGSLVDSVDWGDVRVSFLTRNSSVFDDLRHRAFSSGVAETLLRYVPYRFIRPFFKEELSGLPDHQVNDAVAGMATASFVSKKPLYQLTDKRDALLIHHDWISYLRGNLVIVQEWAQYKLAQYLQDKNPNAQGIINKLEAPDQRGSLAEVRKFWDTALSGGDPALRRCIYSGEEISLPDLSLDHFLPWSLVVHDRIWNLILTRRSVNSSKSNSLPDEQYLKGLCDHQLLALTETKKRMTPTRWNRLVEPFMTDLRVGLADLLDRQKLNAAYQDVMLPLLRIGANQGFPSWTYGREPV